MRRRGIIAVGGGLTIAVAAALVGGDRWRRLARDLDQHSSLFSLRGSRLYGRVAPRIFRGFYRRVADDVASVLDEGTVLDVGTGPGVLALEIARRQPALTVRGVDLSSEMVAIARANAERDGL